MSEDLKYIINGSQLTAIGSAIRSKLGEQTLYTVDQMPTKIGNISGGGSDFITFTINITNNTDYALSAGYSGDDLVLSNYLYNTDGSMQPYCYEGKMWESSSGVSDPVIIASSGGSGSVQVIPIVGYNNIYGVAIDTEKLVSCSAGENVTITDNGYQTIFTLTDPTTSGSFNIEIAEYWPD